MISIICACNNKELLDNMLIPSIKKQTYTNYEIIIVEAKKEGLVGAAQTLNYGASLAKGDILLFCHQDIEFINDDAFNQIISYCNNYDFGIAGVAGKSLDKQVYSSVIQGYKKLQAGIKCEEVRSAVTLDECLFIIKKNTFIKFDETNKSWHLYAVDYSLLSQENDSGVLIFPIKIYHLSPGYSLDDSFYKELLQLGKRHKRIKYIYTTMINIKNDKLFFIRVQFQRFKHLIKKILKRQELN